MTERHLSAASELILFRTQEHDHVVFLMSFFILFLNVRYRILMLLTLYSIHAYHDLIQTCFFSPVTQVAFV